ncbi:MAG TPA: hypothetical protein VK420_15575 [Longimicrobium sp.]|nr:hypothetical protein [Longimicrobium sp.]
MKRHLAALCLFLSTGCENPSGATGLTGAEGELTATFGGGSRFSARGVCRDVPSPVCAAASDDRALDDAAGVSIVGIIVAGNRFARFDLTVSAPEKGTYTLREGCDRCSFVSYQTGDWPGASTLYPGLPNEWEAVSATVKVTDASNGRLRGTFTAVLNGRGLPAVEVRAGSFDVPLRPQ